MSKTLRYGILQSGGSSVPDSVDINKYSINYDWEGGYCDDPYVTVESSGPWTAAWLYGGTNFSADVYSGNDEDTITISCNGENYFAEELTDTLRISRGTAYVDLVITQNAFGQGCA